MSSSRDVAASSLSRIVSDNAGQRSTGMLGREKEYKLDLVHVPYMSAGVLRRHHKEICSVPLDQGCKVIHTVRHFAGRQPVKR